MLMEETLCPLERVFALPSTDTGTEGAVAMEDVSIFGVSTTRKMRGCRGAGESDNRDVIVWGVSGLDPVAEAGAGADTRSALPELTSAALKSSELPLAAEGLGSD